jgi:hypothetical protein
VALRAAKVVEEREGRPVRVPRLPQAGQDEEVEPALATARPKPPRRGRSMTASAIPAEDPAPAE